MNAKPYFIDRSCNTSFWSHSLLYTLVTFDLDVTWPPPTTWCKLIILFWNNACLLRNQKISFMIMVIYYCFIDLCIFILSAPYYYVIQHFVSVFLFNYSSFVYIFLHIFWSPGNVCFHNILNWIKSSYNLLLSSVNISINITRIYQNINIHVYSIYFRIKNILLLAEMVNAIENIQIKF